MSNILLLLKEETTGKCDRKGNKTLRNLGFPQKNPNVKTPSIGKKPRLDVALGTLS